MATGKDADEASFSAYANEMVDNLERCLSEGYTERECMEAFEALTPRNEQARAGLLAAAPRIRKKTLYLAHLIIFLADRYFITWTSC